MKHPLLSGPRTTLIAGGDLGLTGGLRGSSADTLGHSSSVSAGCRSADSSTQGAGVSPHPGLCGCSSGDQSTHVSSRDRSRRPKIHVSRETWIFAKPQRRADNALGGATEFSLRSAGTLPCRILSGTRARDFTPLRGQALTQLGSHNRPPMPTSRGPGARPGRRRAACSVGSDSVHSPPEPLPREVPRRTMRRSRPPSRSRFWGRCTRSATCCDLLRRTETTFDGRISGAPAS